jgi:hypothetical protein
MVGDEERVTRAFCDWLTQQGWSVEREVQFVDVVATRSGESLYCEVKGRTTSPGLDVDTMYGQLLRRMPRDEIDGARFAVVVPDVAVRMAVRVPKRVRGLLGITVYGVDAHGQVVEGDL